MTTTEKPTAAPAGYATCGCDVLCCPVDRIADDCPNARWIPGEKPAAPVKPPAATPTPLHVVRNGRTPKRAELDDAPVLPEWLREWTAFHSTTRVWRKRNTRRVKAGATYLLPVLWWLGCVYPWRGIGRVIALLSKFLYDADSARVRHEHAGRIETKEYTAITRDRRANLRARWTVVAALAATAGVLTLTWVILDALDILPLPPAWAVYTVLGLVWLALGWHGRPEGQRGLGHGSKYAAASEAEKPSAELVVDAIISAVPGITEKHRELFRIHAPGVARARQGYHLSMELPPGSTVSDVMEQREPFAAALRRQLGCVWPGVGHMHPGHMRLFIGDEPMATASQSRWPMGDAKPVDIFDRLPQFTDQQGRWTDLSFAYKALLIGGAPGYGKSFALRQVGVSVGLDPRVKVKCYDGKGNGDLRPLRLIADEFHEGDEPEDIAVQLASVQAVVVEMRRRAKFLRDLPAELNPEDKVTTELVDAFPHLAPIVLLFDEVQVYTEHEDKDIREAFGAAMADLVRRGRSAGIVPVFCTQKPDARVIPTAVTDNVSVRLCFRVNGQRANDAVLGTEMHSSGIKATKFGPDDKGLAWVKGDGSEPQVVRTVYGLTKEVCEEMMRKARAERERRGLLTGYAAGDEAEEEEQQVDLLADCRDILDTLDGGRKAMHFAELLDALREMRAGTYGQWDDAALRAALRAAGIATNRNVWSPVLKQEGKGIRREWLDVAATSDIDPDDEEDNVRPFRRA